IYAPHTTDINSTGSFGLTLSGYANNCKFGAPTVLSRSAWTTRSYLGFEKYNQTTGDHRTEMRFGQLKTDTVVYHTAAPSMRMTPNNASNKLESAPTGKGMLVAVASGGTTGVSVWVCKDTTYTGSQLRLIQRANAALGQNSDVMLAATTDLNSTTKATLDGTPSAGIVMSNGNLTVTHGTTNNGAGVASTTFLSTGKYYFEVTATLQTGGDQAGIFNQGGTFLTNTGPIAVFGGTNTFIFTNGSSTGKNLGVTANGDVFGFAIDLINRLAWIRRNNGNW